MLIAFSIAYRSSHPQSLACCTRCNHKLSFGGQNSCDVLLLWTLSECTGPKRKYTSWGALLIVKRSSPTIVLEHDQFEVLMWETALLKSDNLSQLVRGARLKNETKGRLRVQSSEDDEFGDYQTIPRLC